MTDNERTAGGVVGKLAGKAKAAAGDVMGREDLAREGRLQEAQSEQEIQAQRDAAEAETRQLAARRVRVVPGAVTSVSDTAVTLAGGAVVDREYLVVQTRLQARAGLLADIGLKPVRHPMGVGTHVPIEDPTGRTSVPGVWVAGNIADPMAQVITSAAAGLAAGAMINADLVTAETAAAVAAQAQAASSR